MSTDNPGVLVHPPILYMGALLLGAVGDALAPASLYVLISVPKLVLGSGLVLLAGGITLLVMAIRKFSAAGTNVPTNKPALQLVTDGVYRLSRNPIYVALSCIYLSFGLLWDNPWILVLFLPVVLTMHFGVILREENYLTAKFGEAYMAFKAQTRRWL